MIDVSIARLPLLLQIMTNTFLSAVLLGTGYIFWLTNGNVLLSQALAKVFLWLGLGRLARLTVIVPMVFGGPEWIRHLLWLVPVVDILVILQIIKVILLIGEKSRRAGLTSTAVIVADAHGRIVSWNPAALFMFKYNDNEMRNLLIEDLIPENLRHKHHAAVDLLKKTGKSSHHGRALSTTGLQKGGTTIPISIRPHAQQTDDGWQLGAEITMRYETFEGHEKDVEKEIR